MRHNTRSSSCAVMCFNNHIWPCPALLLSFILSLPTPSLTHHPTTSSSLLCLCVCLCVRACTLQDLKDYMRRAGDVVFSDVNSGTGEGIVEFSNRYVAALAVVTVAVAVAVTVVSSATRRSDRCLICSYSILNRRAD